MTLTKIILGASAAALLSAPALAQSSGSGAYVNLGADAFEFDSYALSGKVGYDFNDYLGAEAQAGFGVGGDDDARFDDILQGSRVQGSVSSEIDNFVAAFARLKFPVSDRVEVFARGGYHFTQAGFETSDFIVTTGGTSQTIVATEDNIDYDGFALGAGAQFMLDDLNGVRLDYTFYDVEEIEDVAVNGTDFGEFGSDVYSVSYVRKF